MSQDDLDFDGMQDAMYELSEDEEMLFWEYHGGLVLINHGLAVLNVLLPALQEAIEEVIEADEDQKLYQGLAENVNEEFNNLIAYIRDTDPQDLEGEMMIEHTDTLLHTVQLVVGICIQDWAWLYPDEPLPTPPLVPTPLPLGAASASHDDS